MYINVECRIGASPWSCCLLLFFLYMIFVNPSGFPNPKTKHFKWFTTLSSFTKPLPHFFTFTFRRFQSSTSTFRFGPWPIPHLHWRCKALQQLWGRLGRARVARTQQSLDEERQVGGDGVLGDLVIDGTNVLLRCRTHLFIMRRS